MMKESWATNCIRCGKLRIKDREEKITLNLTVTKRVIFVCPDKSCQKIVNKEYAEKEAKKLAFQTNRSLNQRNKKNIRL